MQSGEHFLALLDKYTSNTITVTERDELFSLISSGQFDHLLTDHFKTSFNNPDLAGAGLHPERAQEIMQKILTAEKHTTHLLQPGVFKKRKMSRWYMAAAVTLLLITTTLYFLNNNNNNAPAASKQQLTEKFNTTGRPLKLPMEDGSFITLQPGSKLSYPAHFSTARREVYMEGEAFFEVSKNADRPFLVYCNNLVTQVLGTSFTVKNDSPKKAVEVAVITGKVQVYENKNLPANEHENKTNGVILAPNQKVIYKEEDRQFTATLIKDPLPIVHETKNRSVQPASFNFEEASLSHVLQSLERTYGIEIVVENDRIYKCLFTGDVTQYGLYTKLDMVCATVKASYQVIGTKILISGKGCN
jgi:transmembrane sensor